MRKESRMKLSKLVQRSVMLGVSLLFLAGLLVQPAGAEGPLLNSETPGSFLVFPKFDIRVGKSTQIRISDVFDGPEFSRSVYLIFNFVCGAEKFSADRCKELDVKIPITYHGTVVVDVGGKTGIGTRVVPPCEHGFVVVYAARLLDDQPISYNYLIGSYHISRGIGAARTSAEADQAIAIQSVRPALTALDVDGNGGLEFGKDQDGDTFYDYAALGDSLLKDFQAPTDGASTELTLLTLDIFSGAQNPPVLVYIDFWNAFEVKFSTAWEFVCYTQVRLQDIDVNFRADLLGTPYGSLRITPAPNCPFPGLCEAGEPEELYYPTILGAIHERTGTTATLRNLSHDFVPRFTTYYPER